MESNRGGKLENFLPGLELSRRFYAEAVRPILDRRWPHLPHTAGLFGSGSEVLGYDSPMSTDHGWGPRLILLLKADDLDRFGSPIDHALRNELPVKFLGVPTNFSKPDPDDNGTRLLEPITRGPVKHLIQITTVRGQILQTLGFDILEPLSPADWLTFPQQALLEITAGDLFHDDLEFQQVRHHFNYFPHDVWLYLLACRWQRIGQEEHLMGRAGSVGDEIGSALIGGRLVRDLMHICFLMEKTYAPYPKWFGSAFNRLECARSLTPSLQGALAATDWRTREQHLVDAYEIVIGLHNLLGITARMSPRAMPFFNRPFKVIHQFNGIADAVIAQITKPAVRRIAANHRIGGIDTFSDNTDLLCRPFYRRKLQELYS